MKRNVAILFGGRSAEHEVSLVSARAIVKNLDRSRFEPVLIGIDKAGHFQLQDEAQLLAPEGDLRRLSLGDSRGEVVLSPAPEESAPLPRLAPSSADPRPTPSMLCSRSCTAPTARTAPSKDS